jgi:uncharacterized membrane protein
MANKILGAAIAAAVGLSFAVTASNALATAQGSVKCYGISKAGHNACKTAHHACSGKSTKDNDPAEYVMVGSKEDCMKEHGTVKEEGKHHHKKMSHHHHHHAGQRAEADDQQDQAGASQQSAQAAQQSHTAEADAMNGAQQQ